MQETESWKASQQSPLHSSPRWDKMSGRTAHSLRIICNNTKHLAEKGDWQSPFNA